jgi:hypothetical protein
MLNVYHDHHHHHVDEYEIETILIELKLEDVEMIVRR